MGISGSSERLWARAGGPMRGGKGGREQACALIELRRGQPPHSSPWSYGFGGSLGGPGWGKGELHEKARARRGGEGEGEGEGGRERHGGLARGEHAAECWPPRPRRAAECALPGLAPGAPDAGLTLRGAGHGQDGEEGKDGEEDGAGHGAGLCRATEEVCERGEGKRKKEIVSFCVGRGRIYRRPRGAAVG